MTDLFTVIPAIREAINNAIKIDPETGEFLGCDEVELAELQLAEAEIIDGVVSDIANREARIEALKAQVAKWEARITKEESVIENIKLALIPLLGDNTKNNTTINNNIQYKLTIRDVVAMDISDEEFCKTADEQFINHKVVETWAPKKTDIKTALKNGAVVPGAHLEKSRKLSVK